MMIEQFLAGGWLQVTFGPQAEGYCKRIQRARMLAADDAGGLFQFFDGDQPQSTLFVPWAAIAFVAREPEAQEGEG